MFYDKFEALCKEKGVTPNKACLDMGLSRSVAAKWKNTGNNPRSDVLTKIAAYFGVTTSELLGEETKKDPDVLTDTEAKLVDLLMQLTPAEEQKVLAYIEGLLDNRAI